MPQSMDVFANPQNIFLLTCVGTAILCLLVAMSTVFFLIHVRKLRRMKNKNPEIDPQYNVFLLFFGYLVYTLLAFLCAALMAGAPLAAAVYLGIWLARDETLFLPLFVGAIIFGVVVGFYGTFLFLRARWTYTEKKFLPITREIRHSPLKQIKLQGKS